MISWQVFSITAFAVSEDDGKFTLLSVYDVLNDSFVLFFGIILRFRLEHEL